jgi:hypothetical protein
MEKVLRAFYKGEWVLMDEKTSELISHSPNLKHALVRADLPNEYHPQVRAFYVSISGDVVELSPDQLTLFNSAEYTNV